MDPKENEVKVKEENLNNTNNNNNSNIINNPENITHQENITKSNNNFTTSTTMKDFEIIQENNLNNSNLLSSSNNNNNINNNDNNIIKISKAIRKKDKKEYLLLNYPLDTITKNNTDFKKLEGIIEILKILLTKINSPNIINIKESFVDESINSIIIVLESFNNSLFYTDELIVKREETKTEKQYVQ